MANYKQVFMNYMDSKGIKYTEKNERTVRVAYNGDNLRTIPVYVSFDKDGEPLAQFRCWEIANFKDKIAQALFVCNQLNAKYRWIKFYLDDDKDILCECDAYVDERTGGVICLNLVRRMVNIIDESYPTIMKALFD